jgi:signal transduction histidine kinase
VQSPERRRLRARDLALVCAAGGALVTLAVAFVPFLHFAYRNLPLKVALETAMASVGLLVTYLLLGRYRTARRARDLLLLHALGLVAIANLAFAALPTALAATAGARFATWAPLAGRLAGAVLLAAAALVGSERTVPPQGARKRTALLAAAAAVVAGALALAGDALPVALDQTLSPERSARPLLVGHPLVLVAQPLGAVCYGVAAVAFSRQADREGDEFLRWVAGACVLSAFARVNYFLFPSIYTDLVYAGDALRLGFYLLLLVGAQREIASYFEQQREQGRRDERRRVARDLHDGLVQELAFIRAQSSRLARGTAQGGEVGQVASEVARSSERATDEARRAIAALTRTEPVPLPEAVAEAAEVAASRHGGEVGLDLDPGVTATAEEQEALVRVTAEAVGNALRHGGVSEVQIRLARDGERVLEVTDAGRGFDAGVSHARGGHHFGLVSMRERVERVGGHLCVDSSPGRGTRVEVRLP